jgi:alpha-D-xyloside xylohydrolase
LDATEPSFRDGFTQLKQEERTKSAGRNYLGTFHRYLNTYSLELSKFLYEKFKQEDPGKRVFILTRSAFASQQQYATAVWSGDVPASWENMHKQISAGSNLSMSGIPYWTSDIGGFQVTQRGGEFPNGLADDAFKELYTRWFQFGAFSPIFRSHGTDVPREIWQFGEPGSQYYETQLKFIQLRYRLLPYIYSLAKKVSATHYTLMRALVMDFQQDKKTHHINNAYMFGDAFLVRPVTQPMGSEKSIEVQTYLPTHNGRYWYDFWSNQVYEGGNEIIYDTPIDRMPLFVKAGSIIPMANVKQYSLECPDTELEIRIYAGADAQFTLYDDDGLTDNFNQGAFSEIVFDWNENNKTLTIGDLKGSFQPQIQALKFTIHVYDSDTHQPKSQIVDYKGEQIKVQF